PGVGQGLPFLFTDLKWLRGGRGIGQRGDVDVSRPTPYRAYLLCLSTIPLVLLRWPVQQLQLVFGITGAMLLPLLALTLLLMNNRRDWVGEDFRSSAWINAVLAVTLLFFVYVGAREIQQILSSR